MSRSKFVSLHETIKVCPFKKFESDLRDFNQDVDTFNKWEQNFSGLIEKTQKNKRTTSFLKRLSIPKYNKQIIGLLNQKQSQKLTDFDSQIYFAAEWNGDYNQNKNQPNKNKIPTNRFSSKSSQLSTQDSKISIRESQMKITQKLKIFNRQWSKMQNFKVSHKMNPKIENTTRSNFYSTKRNPISILKKVTQNRVARSKTQQYENYSLANQDSFHWSKISPKYHSVLE